jgi:hypothetical protein
MPEAGSLFRELCKTLARVLEIAPNLPEALELRAELESKIDCQREEMLVFLQTNYTELLEGKANPTAIFQRKQLVRSGFRIDKLASIDDGPSLSYLDDLYRAQQCQMTVAEYCETLKSKGPRESDPPSVNRPLLVQGSGKVGPNS